MSAKDPNKLEFGAGTFTIPKGYNATAFTAIGQMDGQAKAMAAGPTMAKSVANQARRTITVQLMPCPDGDVPDEVLTKGLDEAKKASAGTLKNVKDRLLNGKKAKQATIHFRQGALAVSSYVVIFAAAGNLWLIMHSCLDDPKVLEETGKDFEAMLTSFQFA